MTTGKKALLEKNGPSIPFLLSKGGTRIIQIQPTLRCNLKCRHCYSESGPDRNGAIPAKRFENFMSQASGLGYWYVGISGGEPLLWEDLQSFLEISSKIGFYTSIVTNGTLMTPERASELRGRVNLIAVSVEGPPDVHDEMRGKNSFKAMTKGLDALRTEGMPFILLFTLTRYNANQLSWLYEFADKEGARGVEVHPLAAVGAAGHHLQDFVPDSREISAASRLLALCTYLRGLGGPEVTMDAVKMTLVGQSCWPLLAQRESELLNAKFSDLVPSLVIEPDGSVVPFIYGFPRKWVIGNIERDSLGMAVSGWRAKFASEMSVLVHATLDRLAGNEYIDLFSEVLKTALK